MAILSRVPRRWTDAAAGAVLAVGAPVGLCLLRAAQAGALSTGWLRREITGDSATYLYVSVSTAVVFALFGYALGLQADRLTSLSSTDPLTGLLNRRVLHERLEEERSRSIRYDVPLSLLLIDVDGLKAINDTRGHRAGDLALRRVASAVRMGSRSSDLGARWGGDEFALLAPSTDAEAARRAAERIRSLLLEGTSGDDLVSVSIGVATLDPRSPSEAEGLLRAADEALYEAKTAGRNRVAIR